MKLRNDLITRRCPGLVTTKKADGSKILQIVDDLLSTLAKRKDLNFPASPTIGSAASQRLEPFPGTWHKTCSSGGSNAENAFQYALKPWQSLKAA